MPRRGPDGPVVGVLRPGTDVDRDLGGVETRDGHGRLRGRENARDAADGVTDDRDGLLDVLAVRDADLEVDPARVHRAVIDDRTAPDTLVRQNDALVVRRQHHGRHHVDLEHRTGVARGIDDVTDLERLVDGDHETRGEVAERLLERETENEAGDAETGNQRRDVDAKAAQDRDEQDRPADLRDDGHDEVDEQHLAVRPRHRLAQGLVNEADDNPADQQDHGRDEQVGEEVDAAAGHPLLEPSDKIHTRIKARLESGCHVDLPFSVDC